MASTFCLLSQLCDKLAPDFSKFSIPGQLDFSCAHKRKACLGFTGYCKACLYKWIEFMDGVQIWLGLHLIYKIANFPSCVVFFFFQFMTLSWVCVLHFPSSPGLTKATCWREPGCRDFHGQVSVLFERSCLFFELIAYLRILVEWIGSDWLTSPRECSTWTAVRPI